MLSPTAAARLMAAVWLRSLDTDSECDWQKKRAFRTGLLAVGIMVGVAFGRLLWVEDTAMRTDMNIDMGSAALGCALWTMYGMRSAVRLLLGEEKPAEGIWPVLPLGLA